jgi:hypothetical protein
VIIYITHGKTIAPMGTKDINLAFFRHGHTHTHTVFNCWLVFVD